jgi:hypothetical protein
MLDGVRDRHPAPTRATPTTRNRPIHSLLAASAPAPTSGTPFDRPHERLMKSRG